MENIDLFKILKIIIFKRENIQKVGIAKFKFLYILVIKPSLTSIAFLIVTLHFVNTPYDEENPQCCNPQWGNRHVCSKMATFPL